MEKLFIILCFLIFQCIMAEEASNMVMQSLMEVEELKGEDCKFFNIFFITQLEGGSHIIKGKLNMNGQQYSTLCDCSGKTNQFEFQLNSLDSKKLSLDKLNKAKCDPSKLKLHQDREGSGLTFNQVKDIIGYTSELTYVDIETSHFECLDGRNNAGILATPGGDAGEFILGLHVYNDIVSTNRELAQDAVVSFPMTKYNSYKDSFLQAYLQYMKQDKFYMCTDDQALKHLQKELQEVGLNIERPRKQLQPDLLELLIKPENVGSAHIKMLLLYPGLYSVKKELIQMFIKSYYKILWDDDNPLSQKLKLDVLVGNHNEGGFLEVRSNEACKQAGIAPLIKPRESRKHGNSIFVNHLDASSTRRAQIAKFFANEVNHHSQHLNVEMMHNRMNHHGLLFLESTGAYLAKNLPFYTINFV